MVNMGLLDIEVTDFLVDVFLDLGAFLNMV